MFIVHREEMQGINTSYIIVEFLNVVSVKVMTKTVCVIYQCKLY